MKYNSFQTPERRLLGAGPTNLYPEISKSLTKPEVGHLDPKFVEMMDEVKSMLRYLFQTNNEFTIAISAPGSAGMEARFVNLVEPGDKVIGISKFARVADWVFSRPHIQEEAVMILADEIESRCEPKGLAILVKAKHYCMCWRGVKEPNTSMINSIVRGDFRHDASLKQEFFELVKQQPNTMSCY